MTVWDKLSHITWNWGDIHTVLRFLIRSTELTCYIYFPMFSPCLLWGSCFGSFFPSYSFRSITCSVNPHTFSLRIVEGHIFEPVNVSNGAKRKCLFPDSHVKVMSKCSGHMRDWWIMIVRADVTTVWIARSSTPFNCVPLPLNMTSFYVVVSNHLWKNQIWTLRYLLCSFYYALRTHMPIVHEVLYFL